MSTNAYQKILGAIEQWFQTARFDNRPVPIPVRVQIDAPEHRRSMSFEEYRIIKQRRKR